MNKNIIFFKISKFIYALTAWEGSAHDAKVLGNAKLKGFPM